MAEPMSQQDEFDEVIRRLLSDGIRDTTTAWTSTGPCEAAPSYLDISPLGVLERVHVITTMEAP